MRKKLMNFFLLLSKEHFLMLYASITFLFFFILYFFSFNAYQAGMMLNERKRDLFISNLPTPMPIGMSTGKL